MASIDVQRPHTQETQGVAPGLTQMLRQIVDSIPDLSRVEDEKRLHIAVLLSSLTTIIVPHPHRYEQYESYLLTSLLDCTKIFLGIAHPRGKTSQRVALGGVIKLMSAIHPQVSDSGRRKMVGALASVLNSPCITRDIVIDAACCMTDFVPYTLLPTAVAQSMRDVIEKSSSTIISKLSTKALTGEAAREELAALFRLADISDMVRVKMMKRRCMMLVVVKYQSSLDESMRERSSSLLKRLLDCPECVELMKGSNVTNVENRRILTNGLIQQVHKEVTPKLKCSAVDMLRRIALLDNDPDVALSMLDLLHSLARTTHATNIENEDEKNVSTLAAVGYCRLAEKFGFPSGECICVIASFVHFPHPSARYEALQCLEIWAKKGPIASPAVFESLGRVIRNNGATLRNRVTALKISKHLASKGANHTGICRGLLHPIAKFISQHNDSSHPCYKPAIQILVALFTNPTNREALRGIASSISSRLTLRAIPNSNPNDDLYATLGKLPVSRLEDDKLAESNHHEDFLRVHHLAA